VAVFALKYRVPSVGTPETPEITGFSGLPWGEPALMDAQRAVRLVRWWAGHNQSLNLDPRRVGLLGLSSGAHLVAHLAWRHDERLYARLDAVDEENALPDFQILVYPWNLELAPSSRWLSGILRQPSNASRPLPTFRLRARRDTPPTLLAQELTDGVSPGAASAIGYFASLQAEAAGATKRTDELHLYNSTGAHGAGACPQQTSATSTARCGTRHSGTTLGSPSTSLRELHHNPSHRMCEDWPKKALRFMRRLDFACRDVSV
jgi:acetyl esterase/lipase